ncbi:hypothetical protein GCM10010168_03730 [Actinoplanes ianthinogenes]|uniref:PPM-type phosphatase domain-containing protein n=1 Tax=Actinoplanes ianthinogenes TaxID=122358 RepID=A0ABN6CBT1_9ACTN|nr:protein phosphatase 2C domain-containing protein [Actinoplanes ianthinogenes]BCJ42887.1 hypothetical protein Aiant_35440 [Actinoplanes ianthinogenes]GGQ91589.1 hypothetical protein GCM10010168_03730 [Actinoplanes ianthinogenes]
MTETADDPADRDLLTPAGPEHDAGGGARPWARLESRRWVVGDAGRQAAVRARVPRMFRTPPPDVVADGAEAGALTFRAASVRGLGHQERGEPRQDAYAVRFTRDQRWLAGCVADGVSAAKRSHEAAGMICETVAQSLVDHLMTGRPVPEFRWDAAVRAAGDAVTELARPFLPDGPVTYSQVRPIMSATALAFAVETEPSPAGAHRAVLANLAGDSAAFVLTGGDGGWRPLTAVKNDGAAIVDSRVRSLPAEADVTAHEFTLLPGQVLVVMTDGLGDPFGSGAGAVGDFLRSRWVTPPDPLAFAQQVAFFRKSFTDDRTAVVVWPAR